MPDYRVLICGAGIGGLSVARAMQRAGIGVTVFDRAQDVRSVQVGGGFVLWNNGMRALQELGVEPEILAVSSAPLQRFELRSWRGPTLIHWPVAETSAQIGAPSVGILRKDLFGVLFAAVDQGDLGMDHELSRFSQDDGQVTIEFTNAEPEQGTVLVGADGNRSSIRAQLNGANDLVYAGYSLWHAVVEADPAIVQEGVNCTIWGRGIRIIFYPVGGNRMYFSCIMRCREEELSQTGPIKDRLLEEYRGWPHPVEELIASADEAQIRRSDIWGRQPVEHWGEGRVTLLGDAAHPMTPNQGQGACLALEDAVELARCLQKEADPITALRVYEQRRQPRTARVLKRSWTVGRSGAVANPVAVWLRERGMKLRGESVVQGLRDNMVYQFR